MESDDLKNPIQNMDNSLSEVFDTEPMEIATRDDKQNAITVSAPREETNDELETDHQNARSNIYGLIDSGHDALDYALELAKQSDSPRAFEVVATLLKTMSDMNGQLIDNHEKKSRMKPRKEMDSNEPTKSVTNNNAIFVGSTHELRKMLNDINGD